MSGRKLGRLLGSLLVLSVILGGALGVGLLSEGGNLQLTDVIWGAGTFR